MQVRQLLCECVRYVLCNSQEKASVWIAHATLQLVPMGKLCIFISRPRPIWVVSPGMDGRILYRNGTSTTSQTSNGSLKRAASECHSARHFIVDWLALELYYLDASFINPLYLG